MTEEGSVRRRTRVARSQNGNTPQAEEKHEHFVVRESILTVLIENSSHIRAIYHIFVVILLILLLDTVIYDLVAHGKINLGLSAVWYGFGDIGRGARLWLYLFMVAVIYYPCLRLYAGGAYALKKYPALSSIWSTLGVVGLVGVQTALIAVPSYDLKQKHLALASSVTVTCEMFRFAMKMHAVSVACGPRIAAQTGDPPSFQHYLYFLFAPTLLYRDHYPRTNKIRWGRVVFHLAEVMAIIFYNSFLWERFILPYWSDYGKEPRVEAGRVVRSMFACILPGLISYLCGFYCLLHAWLNAFAEMLRFGDRLFYEEWWTATHFSRFFRAWNRVVYSWLHAHIFKPVSTRAGWTFAALFVFFVSAVAHEVILALSFGYFYPVLLVEFGMVGFLLLPITSIVGRRYPNVINLLMWFGFFIGNGILWSLYPMEYFARKNCPPSDSDSFFVPKSWSCPEIILKPDWTFQNPLHVLTR